MNNKYIKIVYESEPIGKERIILYLTTFDIDKYNQELNKKEFGVEVFTDDINFNDRNDLYKLEDRLNKYVIKFYEPYIKEVKTYHELLKTTYQEKIQSQRYIKDVKNITNSDDIHCNIVYGNITNCDNVYCNEIKGNVVNCDKIIYK